MQLHAFPVLGRTTERLRHTFSSLENSATRPAWLLSLQLSRPSSWLLPMVAFACGALASGRFAPDASAAVRLGLGLLLAGPLLTGMNSVVNALFDRDIDAINHPSRPLPSGRLPVDSVIAQMSLMGMAILFFAHLLAQGLGIRFDGSLGVGATETAAIFYMAIASLALIFAINAPPLSLRRNTWWSGLFSGMLVVGIPWITGNLMFGPVTLVSGLFAGCFTFGAVGLLILARLDRVEGDRRVGIRSLSGLLGREMGFGIAVMLLDTALMTAVILAVPQGILSASIAGALLVAQVAVQAVCYRRPRSPRWAYPVLAALFAAAMIAAGGAATPVSLIL